MTLHQQARAYSREAEKSQVAYEPTGLGCCNAAISWEPDPLPVVMAAIRVTRQLLVER
jgi:hypothetical protein